MTTATLTSTVTKRNDYPFRASLPGKGQQTRLCAAESLCMCACVRPSLLCQAETKACGPAPDRYLCWCNCRWTNMARNLCCRCISVLGEGLPCGSTLWGDHLARLQSCGSGRQLLCVVPPVAVWAGGSGRLFGSEPFAAASGFRGAAAEPVMS